MSIWVDTDGRAVVLAHVTMVGSLANKGKSYECFRVFCTNGTAEFFCDLENAEQRNERVIKTAAAKREELIDALRAWHDRWLFSKLSIKSFAAGGEMK